jgi:hypothetical protein
VCGGGGIIDDVICDPAIGTVHRELFGLYDIRVSTMSDMNGQNTSLSKHQRCLLHLFFLYSFVQLRSYSILPSMTSEVDKRKW